MSVILATTYHDAKDRMYDQIAEALPTITHNFAGIALIASSATPARSLYLLEDAGALIGRDDPDQPSGVAGLGRSRRAAEAIVTECHEDSICTDVVWPLFLLQKGGFSFSSISIEGAEFETGDRYAPEVMAAGGYELWLQRLDADPRRWAHRLDLARMQVTAMIPFAGADTHLLPSNWAV